MCLCTEAPAPPPLLTMRMVASVTSGVVEAPFQMLQLPAIMEIARFHPKTAQGKLNAFNARWEGVACQLASVESSAKLTHRNDSDGAQRIPVLKKRVPWALGRNDLTSDCATEANSEVADVNELLDLPNALRRNLPHLKRDEGTKSFALEAHGISYLADNLSARRCR